MVSVITQPVSMDPKDSVIMRLACITQGFFSRFWEIFGTDKIGKI